MIFAVSGEVADGAVALKLLVPWRPVLIAWLACNLFLAVAVLMPAPAGPAVNPEIISKTTRSGYPKYLDAYYFNLASLVIPIAALLFWRFIVKKSNRSLIAFWGLAVIWLITDIVLLVQSYTPPA
jgi:hypothetical protein